MRPTIILALARREVLAQLRSPRLYVVAAFYLFLNGFLYGLLVLEDAPSAFRGLARDTAFLWAFLAPVLGAGCLAGERQGGELETLLAEPIGEGELVAGKWLGLMALLLPLALAPLIPVLAGSFLVPVPWPLVGCTALGLALLALVTGAAAVLASAVSAHPASAALTGVVLLGLLGLAGAEGARRGGELAFLAGGSDSRGLSPLWLLDLLLRGRLDSRPLLIGLGSAACFLWLAARLLAAERDPAAGGFGQAGRAARAGLLPLAVLLAVHQLALRFPVSTDLAGYLEVGPPLADALRSSPEPITVYRPGGAGVRRDSLDDLLDELVREAPGRFRVETLGPQAYASTLRPLGLTLFPADGLVLRRGDRLQVVGGDALEVENRDAERALLGALGKLDPRARRVTVHFVTGHGERPLRALKGDGRVAVSRLAGMLQAEGYGIEALDPRSAPALPAESSVLAILGPKVAFGPDELAALHRWVASGGRLLLALDPEAPALADSFAPALGFQPLPGVVVDDRPGSVLAGGGPASLLAPVEAGHPVGKALDPLRILLPGSMAIQLRDNWEPLVLTSEAAHRVATGRDPADRAAWGPAESYCVAAARRGALLEGGSRVALLGDSELASDRVVDGYPGNAAFVISLVAWLADQPPPASIPREPLRVRTMLDRDQHRLLVLLGSLLPAALALLGGFLAWRGYRARLSG